MDNFPTVHIIVPVYNRAAVTIDFVTRLRQQCYGAIRLYVVDDHSPDGTADLLNAIHGDWDKMRIIDSGGDAWWGGAVHIGMINAKKIAKSQDCILLMNDDISFEFDLVKELVNAYFEKPNSVLSAIPISKGKILRPGSNMVFWPLALTTHPFVNFDWPNENLPRYIPIQFQPARATLYPLRVINEIGGVAYQQLPHYHGDGELSWRAVQKGFESYAVSSIPIYPSTDSTGAFNSEEVEYQWKDLIKSFTEYKSINNLKHRWEFAKLAAPLRFRYPYLIASVSKAMIKSSIMIIKKKYFRNES